jgi:hypothetical protein
MRREFIIRENMLSKNADVNSALKQPLLDECLLRLRCSLAGYFFYRGGSHIAIHATTQTERLIMLEIRDKKGT